MGIPITYLITYIPYRDTTIGRFFLNRTHDTPSDNSCIVVNRFPIHTHSCIVVIVV